MTADPARLDDSELLAQYAAGREEAFAEIARRHGAMVWRAARRVLGDEHEAEDAAQAAFLVLARRARSFRRGGDLAGWLHGIAVRTALEARRARAARRRRDEEAATMTRREELGGAAVAERAEALGRLDAELGRLPALERQAVLLHHLEGRSQQEAARLAGCPVGTLSRRAADGLERLRERLARRGETLGGLALAGLLGAETSGAVPETLLPSLLAVPKLAAAGAAAGVAGGTLAVSLAEGVLKAMFWTKVKLAAAVMVAAVVVGVGSPFAYRAAAGDAPAAGPKTPPAAAPEAVKELGTPAPAEGQAANGLKLVLEPNHEITLRKGARTIQPAEHGLPESQGVLDKPVTFTCDILEDRGESLLVDIYAGQHAKMIFQKADMVSKVPVAKWPRLRWENVGKEPLRVTRRRASDLRVFLKSADGKLAPAREYSAREIDPVVNVDIQPGQADAEPFYPQSWVAWPAEPGEYTLWVEFEQKMPERNEGRALLPKGYWIGKVRSNELKVRIEDPTAGQAVNGLQVGGVRVAPAEWAIPDGKGPSFEDVLADLVAHKALDDQRGQGIFSFRIEARFTNAGKSAFRLQTDIIQLGIGLRDEGDREVNIAQMFIPGPSKDAPVNFPVLKPGATLPMTIAGHLLADGRVIFEFASRNDLRMVEHSVFPLKEGRYKLRVTSQNGLKSRGGGTEFDFADDFWTGSAASGEVTITVKKRPTPAPAPAGPAKPPGEVF